MRKMKLLLALIALFLGTTASWAQKDVTSQYITNATLSNGTTGWTVSNFNDPKKGNNTVGYASEAYSGWGGFDPSTTPYYLKQTITLPAGHYTLVNYSFYREGEAYNTDSETSRAKLYAGTNEKDILTLGSLNPAPSGYANSQADGANCFDSKMYRNTVDFTIDVDNTSIEIGLTGTFSIMRSWCIAGMFELINNDIPATMDAPFDVTGYITNPGFEYRNMAGWTLDGDFGAQGNNQSFKVGGYYAEKWQPSSSGALGARSMSQTLTNLPAGFYKLTANLGGDGTYIDLNGKIVNWEADKDYTVGYVLAENEDLVITAGKTAEGTANWIHFDNFRLQFCGDVAAALTTLCAEVTNYENQLSASDYATLLSAVNGYNKSYSDVDELLAAIDAVQALYDSADLYIEYTTALDAANAIDQETPMNGDVLSALQTAIANTVTMATTAAEKVAATNALNTATANANTSIANYAEAKVILDAANSYDAAGQASYAADETIAAIQSAYDDRTLTAVTAEQKAAAQAALATACKAQIQPADGCDMTAYIVNPNFDSDAKGWTTEKIGNGWTAEPYNGNNHNIEYWSPSVIDENASTRFFDYHQTITNLPTGAYTISASMLNSTNGEENEEGHDAVNWNGGGNAGVYGKTTSDEQRALITINDQTFRTYTTAEILVVDGELRIGVKNINPLTGRWFAADNFKLTYARQLTAEEEEAIAKANAVAAYEEALAAAQAIAEGSVPTPVYTNLQTVITDNTLEDGTSSEYNDAAAALNEAAADAQALVAPYAVWKELKAYADALVVVAHDNATANATLASVISTQNDNVESVSATAAGITEATSTLKTAMVTYVGDVNPVGDGAQFDCTFMLTNPDLSVFKANGPQDGWYTDQTFNTQNSQVMQSNNAVANTADNTKFAMYEYWSDASCATSGYTVYTKLDLPVGTYKMEALCMTGWGYHASEPDGLRNITFSAGETDGTSITTSTLEPANIEFVQTSASEVKIGLKAHEGNTCNWMGIGYVQLFKVQPKTFTISEDADYDTTQEGAGAVTLTRTIKENTWNTIWLPFSMTEDDLKNAFGNDVEIAEYSETPDGDNSTYSTVTFKKMDNPAISPLKPVLLRTSTAGTTYTIPARTVVAGTPAVSGTNFDFVGTYKASIKIEEGNYFISDNKLWKAEANKTTIKGTRAYLKGKTADARIAEFSIGESETTGISTIAIQKFDNAAYDMQGRRVETLKKGVYVVNGKKVVVK